jgi:hypothetical protein
MPDGSGCTVPPQGASFYPYYSVSKEGGSCAFFFGNLNGNGFEDFGGDAQYDGPNLDWFFGQSSSGERPNPCIPD